MAKFEKAAFNYHGGYLTYGADRRFVARFKHVASNKPSFMSFLIKNFDADEYFARLLAGESPVGILESKGYVMAHIKKWLRDAGLPETLEGRAMLLDRQYEARKAK